MFLSVRSRAPWYPVGLSTPITAFVDDETDSVEKTEARGFRDTISVSSGPPEKETGQLAGDEALGESESKCLRQTLFQSIQEIPGEDEYIVPNDIGPPLGLLTMSFAEMKIVEGLCSESSRNQVVTSLFGLLIL